MPLPTPPAPIDPEIVPGRKWLVFEDSAGDRWMVPGLVDVRNSDGTNQTAELDDGDGGPVYLGTDTGDLYFRLDLTAGVVTAVAGPLLGSLPADTATELHFLIAEIASADPGDFTQSLEGPFRWQNSGDPPPWGAQPLIFTAGGEEIGRISFDRGQPIQEADWQIAVDGDGFPAVLTGVASAGTFPVETWNLVTVAPTYVTYAGVEDPAASLFLDRDTGDATIGIGGTPVIAERLGGSTADLAGIYTANEDGEDDFNGGNPWTYTVS